jgi:hypothetical protein
MQYRISNLSIFSSYIARGILPLCDRSNVLVQQCMQYIL